MSHAVVIMMYMFVACLSMHKSLSGFYAFYVDCILARYCTANILEFTILGVVSDFLHMMQILPLFNKSNVIHFNKTDARLANNLPIHLQKLRCHVNFHALKFTPQLEALGNRLVQILQKRGSFIALHLRYEMDMLAFSGCTHGCSKEEAEELKSLRFETVTLCVFEPLVQKYQFGLSDI